MSSSDAVLILFYLFIFDSEMTTSRRRKSKAMSNIAFRSRMPDVLIRSASIKNNAGGSEALKLCILVIYA